MDMIMMCVRRGGTGSKMFPRCERPLGLLPALCVALLLSAPESVAIAQEMAVNYAGSAGAQTVRSSEIPYSDFLEQVRQGSIKSVIISGDRIRGEFKGGAHFGTISPETNNSPLIAILIQSGIRISGEHPQDTPWPIEWLLSALPIVLMGGLAIYLVQRKPNEVLGSDAMTGFGKSRARLLGADQRKITFADVAGIEEAKQEVAELVDFLKDPGKYQALGGKIPRGVLMVGPPGTGKTLLAKAIAGEAGVPFFTVSGSDFVEMFVGVGASRVRDMFDEAEKQAPCIIFIDEIDAVGRHRGGGLSGGHDEREQTLNQLLVRMDGVEGSKGVIVIAATNRPDVLDVALLRPGRFDRQVVVPLPDVRGREQILRAHMRAVPLADDVNPETIARGAPGFSGADLANLVNEAALFAARCDKQRVEQNDFEKAQDKIMMGAERRSLCMSEQEKKLTAYHEAGHAIVGLNVPDHDPVYKVSVIPRGRTLGVTVHLPDAERSSYTREFLNSRICSLFGGRVAEELIFGADQVTTGASNDIQRATAIARNMVTRYGMSAELGPLACCDDDQAFLPGRAALITNVSNDTARAIDQAVRAIIDRNYARARNILECHVDTLHRMAGALIQYETLDHEQIQTVMQGRDPGPPASWTGTAVVPRRPTRGAKCARTARSRAAVTAAPAT